MSVRGKSTAQDAEEYELSEQDLPLIYNDHHNDPEQNGFHLDNGTSGQHAQQRLPFSSGVSDKVSRIVSSRNGKWPRKYTYIVLGVVVIVLFLFLVRNDSRVSVSASLQGQAQGWGYNIPSFARIKADRPPRYDDPFNPDDLTFTEEQCDAYFPLLYREVDRSVAYYTENPITQEYLEDACSEPGNTHLRVKVLNNRLYIVSYIQSDFTRTQATLALLHNSIVTSREPLPNVEFCMGLQDWPGRGKFGLDRAPQTQDVWLMPDYAWWSWPEHVGSYHDLRRRMEDVERATPWEKKHPRLLWRGNMKVGTADREALLAAAEGHEWSDVKPVNWGAPPNESNAITMEAHCAWKYQGFPEGNSYSGRLRYLQNCKTVIVTHEPKWLQHWTHLYNSDWASRDQNIVLIPPPPYDPNDTRSEPEKLWSNLQQTMSLLLNSDAKAKQIATTQYDFFRNRYISPASATCYWRRALRGYAQVTANLTVELKGDETTYESWFLKGMRNEDEPWKAGVQ